jgi:hypothetical protein
MPPGCRISPPPSFSAAASVLSSAHARAAASSAVCSSAPAHVPPPSSPPPSPAAPRPPPPTQAPPQSAPAVLRYILAVLPAACAGSAPSSPPHAQDPRHPLRRRPLRRRTPVDPHRRCPSTTTAGRSAPPGPGPAPSSSDPPLWASAAPQGRHLLPAPCLYSGRPRPSQQERCFFFG